jgi:HK97 family phage major capsid protein
MRLQDLKEKRSHKVAEMRSLNEKALGENRDLDDGERKSFEAKESEVRSLDAQIKRTEELDRLDRYVAASENGNDNEQRSLVEGFSVGKAILEGVEGKLTGREAEYSQERRNSGGQRRGNGMHIAIPAELILGGEQRALTTDSNPAGGYLVSTDHAPVTGMRRAGLVAEGLGANVMRNLVGDLAMSRQSSGSSASWVGEHEDSTRTDIAFEQKLMSPKTASAEIEVSRRMLLQTVAVLDRFVRADMSYNLAQLLDRAAIRGGSSPKQPMGILSDPNVGTVTGGDLDSDIAADLIGALETDNVTGTTGFLTNPAVMNVARKTKDEDGHVIPLSEIFHGEPVVSSTQVPGDIGSGSDKNALIFGEWASLYIGYWSSIDILLNPYHSDVASKGGALLHAFLDCDVIVRNPEGFKYAEIN